MKVSDRLTDIAELIIQCCMDLAWQQMTDVYGVPYCGDQEAALRPVRVAVAGYGKLGGLELGYVSDLDLVFLHDSRGEIQQTKAARPLDNTVFFLRLGQRIVHLLTMHSAAGRLYEVDMRLRPNGKGGFLMTGIDAFERYQRQDAWTWEHQALLRARPVAGDAGLCAAFEAARRRILSSAVRRDTLRNDVLEMRLRMQRELSKAGRDNSTSSRMRAASPTSSFWCNTGCWRRRRRIRPADLLGQYPAARGFGGGGSARGGDGAMADGGLYRLSYDAASPLARGPGRARGGGGSLRGNACTGDRDLARYF